MKDANTHFIHIHIALRTAARLPYNQWKVVVQFTGDHFISRCRNRICQLGVETVLLVNERRCLLQNTKRVNNGHLQTKRSESRSEEKVQLTGIRSDASPILKLILERIVCAP